jgi:acetyl esterase/lipase
MQLVSQILHPRADVPEIHLPAPLRGLCLASPWVALTPGGRSPIESAGKDYLRADFIRLDGARFQAEFAETDVAFSSPAKAPEAWFAGMERVVERVLVTAGGDECFRDDIVNFGEGLKTWHPDVELVVQKNGLHADMYLDFMVGEKKKKLGVLTPLLVEWLSAGFSE